MQVGEDLAAGERSCRLHIEHPDMRAGRLFAMGAAGIDDIELALVEREGEAVRAHHVGRPRRFDLAAVGIDAIDVAGADLALGLVAFIVAVDAVGSDR